MKFIASLILLFSAEALANPFDSFVGTYSVQGEARIRSEKGGWCKRYDFPNIYSVIIQMSGKPNETHGIRMYSSTKTSLFTVQTYYTSDASGDNGAFAEISGDEQEASNVKGSWTGTGKIAVRVTVAKSTAGYVFRIKDEYFKAGVLQTGCYYEVDLAKSN